MTIEELFVKEPSPEEVRQELAALMEEWCASPDYARQLLSEYSDFVRYERERRFLSIITALNLTYGDVTEEDAYRLMCQLWLPRSWLRWTEAMKRELREQVALVYGIGEFALIGRARAT